MMIDPATLVQLQRWKQSGCTELYSVHLRLRKEFRPTAPPDELDDYTTVCLFPNWKDKPDTLWKITAQLEEVRFGDYEVQSFHYLGSLNNMEIPDGPDPRANKLGDTPDQDGC